MEELRIAQTILNELAYTVSMRDLDAHMELISRDVKVLGLKHQVVNFEGWRVRRENEFNNRLLKRVTYDIPRIIESDDHSITFSVTERLKASDGKCYVVEKEIILMREKDLQWRVLLETIHRARII